MDEFIDQKFLITVVEEPQPWIGADRPPPRPGATTPVIIDGEMKDWSFRDGYLILNEGWYSTHDENEVVVRAGVIEGTRWSYIKTEKGIRIKSPEDDTFWTATLIGPERKVILAPAGSINPNYQTWNFIPAN